MKKKAETKIKTKMKTKAKLKIKTKTKPKMKTKMKKKTKMRIKSFCVFFNSILPRYAIDGQLSLTWPGSAIVFLFANFARGLAVP